MSNWKTANRSFYYDGAPPPEDPVLARADTALLVIDLQNCYLWRRPDGIPPEVPPEWAQFDARLRETVLPRTAAMIAAFRDRGMEVIHARIACQHADGRDRSLSQKKPGWNNLLLPKDAFASKILEEVTPAPDEIVVTKTTDSALTGTNLRLGLSNMGIRNVVCAGIFTDQCVSSTVRSLADESFDVIVLDDCCAAGTEELHRRELEVLNMIYCQVMRADDLLGYLPD
ncbi:cysteine hydrolase family protein [Mangrovicoccus algicola]|uniref:Cysteine hydrolase family protein n=1 Tax=Mangrovicoccus algicola TaxID=2771008 RepID=A0A8J6YWX3_9RHOB|nr:cysteine hydrolase family protein [Mangrovicoccus algicola]MBE3639112.1 cysteine hydrolase family protein [Mangrovicoccus algicola]